jgi:SH3-like domain-containing protein
MGRAVRVLAAVLCAAAVQAASAVEFRSVGAAAAVLYDAPSLSARKLFVAPRGMPLEVLTTVGGWVKVRDAQGDAVWIERAHLSGTRTVVARTGGAAVRALPQEGADLILQAERGVLLELLEPPAKGWARVRHQDGNAGYVRAAEVWGL